MVKVYEIYMPSVMIKDFITGDGGWGMGKGDLINDIPRRSIENQPD